MSLLCTTWICCGPSYLEFLLGFEVRITFAYDEDAAWNRAALKELVDQQRICRSLVRSVQRGNPRERCGFFLLLVPFLGKWSWCEFIIFVKRKLGDGLFFGEYFLFLFGDH